MYKNISIGVIKKDVKYTLISTALKYSIKINDCDDLDIIVEGLDYIDPSEIGNMIKKYSKNKSN